MLLINVLIPIRGNILEDHKMEEPTIKRLFMSFLLVVVVAAAVQAQTASFSFVVPAKVIFDVPFSVQLQVHTEGEEFIAYDLSVGTDTQQATFGNGLSRGDSFLLNALTQNNGQSYRVVTDTNGNVMKTSAPTTLLTFTDVRFQGTGTGGTFILLAQPRKIIHSTAGKSYTLSLIDSSIITPSLSTCGDGVVGYDDANSNGIKDSGETNEACDDGNDAGSSSADNYAANKDGCSADCKVIDIGYACTNTAFGSSNSACTKMDKVELFRTKMNAFFAGQCFPNTSHPGRIYTFFCDSGKTFQQLKTSQIIGAFKEALVEYITS